MNPKALPAIPDRVKVDRDVGADHRLPCLSNVAQIRPELIYAVKNKMVAGVNQSLYGIGAY
jgi:hypothetical protein